MYSLAVSKEFIANHYLVGGDWGRENIPHAHPYRVEIQIEGEQLEAHGYLLDIVEVEAALETLSNYYRDSLLNDKPEFTGLNPSIEHFSRILHRQLGNLLPSLKATSFSVKLWENAYYWAAYRPNAE